jgi:hypothetical protein
MLSDFGNLDAAKGSRAQAFGLLESFFDALVSTASLRVELGASWGNGHDAGRLEENAPNWPSSGLNPTQGRCCLINIWGARSLSRNPQNSLEIPRHQPS